MIGPRATMLGVALIASLAGGGGAAASVGNGSSTGDSHRVAHETSVTPVMELPSGCGGDDWSFDSSID